MDWQAGFALVFADTSPVPTVPVLVLRPTPIEHTGLLGIPVDPEVGVTTTSPGEQWE